MQECRVNILGTEYEILYVKESEDAMLKNVDGYMDPYTKQIVVALIEADEKTTKNQTDYYKHTLRHEIVHAFLYESGLWCDSSTKDAWGVSEEITDWIALQFPNMMKAFQEVGAL